jgi:hypothetical protein
MTVGATARPLFAAALKCDCCREVKHDASVRPGLHPVDDNHRRTEREFRGVLCDKCLAGSRRRGSKERRWLLGLLTRLASGARRRK